MTEPVKPERTQRTVPIGPFRPENQGFADAIRNGALPVAVVRLAVERTLSQQAQGTSREQALAYLDAVIVTMQEIRRALG